ncbi:MAG TPA: hypothetical protein VLI54_00940 [Bacillota bacterium]|nr:hypothetical protein [Bacillota bacterium]
MTNYIAQLIVLALVLVLAGLKSLHIEPTEVPEATSQKQLQALLKLQEVLQSNLLLLNIILLLLLALSSYGIFQILAFGFCWLVVIHLLTAAAGLGKRAHQLALRHLSVLLKLAAALKPALDLLDNTRFIITRKNNSFSSKQELLQAVRKSRGLLSKEEHSEIERILTQ